MTSGAFRNLTGSQPLFDQQDCDRMTEIAASVRGYSEARHYRFVRSIFTYTGVRRIRLLGIYFGRDTVFMCEAARRCGRSLEIAAVDKLSNDACDDWPSTKKTSPWEEAGLAHPDAGRSTIEYRPVQG
jgi:hypothetical protein